MNNDEHLNISAAQRARRCLMALLMALLGACHSVKELPLATPQYDGQSPFPLRQAQALTGSGFLLRTGDLNPDARERAIATEILNGNVPRQMRQLVPLTLTFGEHSAIIFVVPDYLAIGADDDYVVMPMRPQTAMHIARHFGYLLPTRKLVDDIYRHAAVRLQPAPMRAGPHMRSNDYYRRHNRLIKKQLVGQAPSTTLIAGHKKDVVLTPQLADRPDRVAIYGWHRGEEDPIQPLSLYHGANYVDYSHGVRLISRRATVDGRQVDLATVFTDPELNPLVSDEGKLPASSYL